MITNSRTVTIKMTRGQALLLSRMITNYVECLRRDELRTCDRQADNFEKIREKIQEGVKKLDESEKEA